MFTNRFLRHRRGASLTSDERAALEKCVDAVVHHPARHIVVRSGQELRHSTVLVDGFMCRYQDDRRGLRQLVAVHVPGDFVDLHGYPLHILDHDVATLTATTIATVPHEALDRLTEEQPALARKLWYSTLLDAAIHRAWLFRLGRLDAAGRIAHFLCEIDARLQAVGLSDGRSFTMGITQADVAEICGLTPVHINRVIRTLREEQIVTFRGSMVEILDPVRLRRRGEFTPNYLYLDDEALQQSASSVGNA